MKEAATLFAEARATRSLLAELPPASRPKDASDAYAIQLETLARLKDGLAGWKVALSKPYELLYAALLRSRVFEDGATVPSDSMSMAGVEAEIALRFDNALPPRERSYDRDEIVAAVSAFAAIEILDTRFRDYNGAPEIDRAADFMSNSAFVFGACREDWRSFDLGSLEARLEIDGKELVRAVGGHAAGDPLIPAIALANTLRHSTGIPIGRVATTGTYTGLNFVDKNCAVRATFSGFGSASCRLATLSGPG